MRPGQGADNHDYWACSRRSSTSSRYAKYTSRQAASSSWLRCRQLARTLYFVYNQRHFGIAPSALAADI